MSELPKKAWSMNATAGLFYALSLGALVALAGCADDDDDDDDDGAVPAPTSTATRIGVMGPFQGPNALLGEQIKVAAEMAFAEIDYRIGSKEIELVFIDSSSDPSVAVPNYEDAIVNQNVIAGFSNWHSDVSLAVMDVVADHGIPHYFAGGQSDEINAKHDADPARYGVWLKGLPLLIVDTITVHRNSLGSTADGVLDLDPRYRDTVAAQQFIDDFTARLGVPPSSLSAGVAYDYARFFIDLLNVTLDTHGELTSANILEVGESQLKTGQLSFTDGVVMTEYRYSPDSVPDPETGNGLLSYSDDSGDSTVVWPAGQLRAP